ncbi:MAG TPA: YeeE/YedE thiosulfate transporter family protein [Polyangiales bacterium]|nr:YeeE/YedE thiosulfate transporter family protein [Polyangiales bacterium]
MHNFTPMSSALGGILIGIAASILLIGSGRIAGVSGILGGILVPTRGDRLWRWLFMLGLISAGGIASLCAPELIAPSPRPLPLVISAGLLVGVGTRLGNGCTSGHGVCGISRLSLRSLVATAMFIATGIIAAHFVANTLAGAT